MGVELCIRSPTKVILSFNIKLGKCIKQKYRNLRTALQQGRNYRGCRGCGHTWARDWLVGVQDSSVPDFTLGPRGLYNPSVLQVS